MEIWIRVHPVLELLCIVGIRQMKMRARHKGRRFYLTLGHILDSSAQVVPKTAVFRVDCPIGKTLLQKLELDCWNSKVV